MMTQRRYTLSIYSPRAALVGVVMLFFSAIVGAQSWGDLQSSGYRESASTATYSPGRYAFDGDTATAWQLSSGSTEGWVEAYAPTAQRYAGARVEASLPAGVRLSISVLSNGAYVAVPGGTIQGPFDGSANLVFPGELAPTTRVLVELSGQGADQAKVYEIQWRLSLSPARFGMILPASYTTNFTEYINLKASRLWNGINDSDWYEPLDYIPDEPFQTDEADRPAGIFPPYRGDPPTQNGQIVWQLDGTYQIEVLKAFILTPQRWVRFEFWVNGQWTDAQDLKDQRETGWQRVELATPVTTNQVRISFPGGWGRARGIGQIQVWGEGWADAPSRPLVISSAGQDGYQQFTLDDVAPRDYQLTVTVPGTLTNALTGQWNGKPISLSPMVQVSGSTIYRTAIPAESVMAGQQFLELQSGGSLTGVSLENGDATGAIDLGSPWDNGFFDQSDSSGSNPLLTHKSWDLGGTYQLEKLRVYMKSSATPLFQTKLGGSAEAVRWTNEGEGWWEADLGGEEADTLAFTSALPAAIDQIQLYGTPLYDRKVAMEIWWPQSSSGSPVTSDGQDGNSVIGWVGDASTRPTINGFQPRQEGMLFWMPLGQMNLSEGGEYSLSVGGDLDGLSTQIQNTVQWWRPGQASLTQGTALATTTQSSMTLSGTDTFWGSLCYIGGVQVPVVGGAFSYSAQLSTGYQIIPVEIWDRHKKNLLASWEKPVYRSLGQPTLTFDLPHGDLWTQSPTMLITGRVGNGPGLSLGQGGQALKLSGDAFQETVNLSEGAQTLSFVLSDSLGRTTTENLVVTKDSTAPQIAIVSPTSGQYLPSSTFAMTVSASGATPLWLSLNGGPWEPEFTNPLVQSFRVPDGFYTYTAQAQDRAGNLGGAASVTFCVDTTPPLPFTITSTVSGWTNNNQPTIGVATTDATSGIDHYECSVDGGAAATVASPCQLPTLSDGTHQVTVTAYDKAGNGRTASIAFQIDTTPPPAVTGLQGIPGTNQITVSWAAITSDLSGISSYYATRTPVWSDGTHSLTGTSFVDTTAVDGTTYTYTVWAADGAGNVGAQASTSALMAGLASATVNQSGPTVVQYNRATLTVPAGMLASDVSQVQIGEVPQSALTDAPVNTIVSSIYRIIVTRVDNGVSTVSDHAALSGYASMRITYDPSLIPQGLAEANLKPCYYDDVWGRWIPIAGAHVDPNSHSIMFTTNHFSDYSVQAVAGMDLAAAQLGDSVAGPLATTIGQTPVVASSSAGTVSTSFTEAVLPGKNHLDLVL